MNYQEGNFDHFAPLICMQILWNSSLSAFQENAIQPTPNEYHTITRFISALPNQQTSMESIIAD